MLTHIIKIFNEAKHQTRGKQELLNRYQKIILSQLVRMTIGIKGNTLYKLNSLGEYEKELWDEPELIEHLKSIGYLRNVEGSDIIIVNISRYDECFEMAKEI